MLKIGEIMLRKRWISLKQLEYALYLCKQTNLRLGETLIQLGWINEDQLQEALKEQHWRRLGLWVIN